MNPISDLLLVIQQSMGEAICSKIRDYLVKTSRRDVPLLWIVLVDKHEDVGKVIIFLILTTLSLEE